MTGNWPETRHAVAYEEARAVIDAQNATMTDIDDKAMRTVRLNAVLIGLLVTGLQFASASFDADALRMTVVCLVTSTVCGVITYNESNLYVGPGGAYIEAIAEGDNSDRPWSADLPRSLSAMISENHQVLNRNARWLTATQGTLVLGITSAVAAVAI